MPMEIVEHQTYPHFVADSIEGRITEYLRRKKSDCPLPRLRAELQILNDLRSQIHSLDWRIYQLDERKQALQVNPHAYKAIARPDPTEELGGPSLFRKPGSRVLVEVTGPNRKEQDRIAAEAQEV